MGQENAQTYQKGDRVRVLVGADRDRHALVVANYKELFPLTGLDGARIHFIDEQPTLVPFKDQAGVERDYNALSLAPVS
jgi:hypothetical protein